MLTPPPERAKQLSTVATLLFRFLDSVGVSQSQFFYVVYQPCSFACTLEWSGTFQARGGAVWEGLVWRNARGRRCVRGEESGRRSMLSVTWALGCRDGQEKGWIREGMDKRGKGWRREGKNLD